MTEGVETKFKYNSHFWIDQIQSFDALIREEQKTVEKSTGIKLGWIKGVLIPCLLSIWGVMLFLKMQWILGHAGILDSLVIIFISLIIILITTFSLSAISTNGRIKGGGLYFIISRSIGPGFGASIGVLLAVANTISAAMNTIGFCTSLNSLLKEELNIYAMDNTYVYKTVGVISIIIMSILCCIGMDREAEVQNALLVSILVGIFNVLIGSYIGPTNDTARASGFTGFSWETFQKNWYSDYRLEGNIQHSFFSIFAIFFPSVTGIQAGANISGDLKDPSASIPKGTLLSIFISISSYVVLIVVPGSVQLREASGNLIDYEDNTYLNCSIRKCTKGLYTDPNLMQSISLAPLAIYFGCFGATISTALIALISSPKIIQRMGQDNVYPFLKYLAKGYGKRQEPYCAHLLAVVVSSSLLVFGNVDAIAPIVSTIYLCAYAMLNLCVFHVAYFKPLGWRPSYKFYNKWLSFFGAIVCFTLMILIDWMMSVIVGCAIYVLYTIAARKKYVINWGSSRQIQKLRSVVNNLYMANTIRYHVKNHLPNIIVLSGKPESRKKLISLANLITENNGLQICVNVVKESLTMEQRKTYLKRGTKWLKSAKINSLYVVLDNAGMDVATHMVYSCSHGLLRPNIVLVGYKSDWLNCPIEDLHSFLNIFHVAAMNEIASIMVRVSSTENFEYQNLLMNEFKHLCKHKDIPFKTSSHLKNRNQRKISDCFVKINHNEFSFTDKSKQKNRGTVDVWWLYDDGGLTLVITNLLKCNAAWKYCKFRIFGVTNKIENLRLEKNKLKQLLSLYRIDIFDYIDIILVNNTDPTTMAYFTSLLKRAATEDDQFERARENIAETLFLRDLIELHSFKSDLIILSTPRANQDINILYMCWIETITRGLPPCIIINGNKVPILTANA